MIVCFIVLWHQTLTIKNSKSIIKLNRENFGRLQTVQGFHGLTLYITMKNSALKYVFLFSDGVVLNFFLIYYIIGFKDKTEVIL